MSSLANLCLLSFLEETAEITDWYMLGLYMGVPPKDLAQIEKQSSSQGSARCRAELFGVWMKRTQNASWELIAAALGKLGETVLAEKIRSRCVALLVSSPEQLAASSTVKNCARQESCDSSFNFRKRIRFFSHKPQDVSEENKCLVNSLVTELF